VVSGAAVAVAADDRRLLVADDGDVESGPPEQN
jgi:hypothetical protein